MLAHGLRLLNETTNTDHQSIVQSGNSGNTRSDSSAERAQLAPNGSGCCDMMSFHLCFLELLKIQAHIQLEMI